MIWFLKIFGLHHIPLAQIFSQKECSASGNAHRESVSPRTVSGMAHFAYRDGEFLSRMSDPQGRWAVPKDMALANW
jgi:hypothetical protein